MRMEHFKIYLNALQAVWGIMELPSVDAERSAVIGGSQGGGLAVVVAALELRIQAAVPAVAHYGVVPWVRWVDGQNQAAGREPKAFPQAEYSRIRERIPKATSTLWILRR